MNTDKIIAEKIASEYAPKKANKVVALKKLDRKAKQTAEIFSFTFGIISTLIMGTGMCYSMDVEKGVRSEDVIERSIAKIPMYQTLDTIIIDTNAKDVAVIANEIKQL